MPRVALAPSGTRVWLRDAIVAGGGELVEPEAAEALVWSDPGRVEELRELLATCDGIRWVALPWAGIEPFVGVLDPDRTWTCGKGVYAEPVAEHALALMLAGLRHLVQYSREREWTRPAGRNVLGSRVTVLGGGGITESLLRLLGPFDVDVTVVRRHPRPMAGASKVVTLDELDTALAAADALVLALALTPETVGVIGGRQLARVPDHCWIVNVARGRHIVTGELVDALRAGAIGGAALDVTDPEPLPADHPLWTFPNCIITPHTANTPEMAEPLLFARIRDNIRRYATGEPLVGLVDPALGY